MEIGESNPRINTVMPAVHAAPSKNDRNKKKSGAKLNLHSCSLSKCYACFSCLALVGLESALTFACSPIRGRKRYRLLVFTFFFSCLCLFLSPPVCPSFSLCLYLSIEKSLIYIYTFSGLRIQ